MILIAGGAGYIGSHINHYLHQAGIETVVFDNLSLGHSEFVKWGHFFKGDLNSITDLRTCFKMYPIHAVFHLCAFANVGESMSKPEQYYQNNVVNTLNLLQVMREFKTPYFVFSSTCATYGSPDYLPLTENHPQHPINPYGKSKLMVEQILNDYDTAYGLKSICLRYFNAAGADFNGLIGERHTPETHLIPLVCHAILGLRESISIFGSDYNTSDGTCVRDYIHILDLAKAHLLSLRYLEKNNLSNAFNLGNGEGFSVKQIIEKVQHISGKSCKVTYADRRDGDPAVLLGSSEKAKNELSWSPSYGDIDTIIESAWKWHLKEFLS